MMHPQRYLFNYYTMPGQAADMTMCFAADPVILLEQLPDPKLTYQRHQSQLRQFPHNWTMPYDRQSFALPADWRYAAYQVLRLTSDPEKDDPTGAIISPVGNLPPRADGWRSRADELRVAAAQLASQRTKGHFDTLYLFNVIVALEWIPSPRYLRRLEWAFRRASDLLYDVTNGCMAFGQVLFGGPNLMPCADVQIMASNRLLPRSWVSGLLEPHKYVPIRIGRGLWDRGRRVALDWDQQDGYGTIVHEWCHYALGMKDEYLETVTVQLNSQTAHLLQLVYRPPAQDDQQLVLPKPRLTGESIMATAQGNSEFANPLLRGHNDFPRSLAEYYPELDIRRMQSTEFSGPGRLPLPLPVTHYGFELSNEAYWHTRDRSVEEQTVALHITSEASSPAQSYLPDISTETSELYVVRKGAADVSRVVAQGELDGRYSGQLTFFGARVGDRVLVLERKAGASRILTGALDQEGVVVLRESNLPSGEWGGAAVMPKPMNDGRGNGDGDHEVQPIIGFDSQESATVFSFGDDSSHPIGRDLNTKVTALDGYLVLKDTDDHIIINPFSQGGGPQFSPNVSQSPVHAGSSNGTVLVFFRNDLVGDEASEEYSEEQRKWASTRVVTTLLNHLPFYAESEEIRQGFEAQGPAFSIASNQSLDPTLHPTLLAINHNFDAASDELWLAVIDANGLFQSWLDTYPAPNNTYAAAPLIQVPVLFDQKATTSERGPVAYFQLLRRRRG